MTDIDSYYGLARHYVIEIYVNHWMEESAARYVSMSYPSFLDLT